MSGDTPHTTKKDSFWKTLPGIIAAAGSLIGAIAALLIALDQVGFLNQKQNSVNNGLPDLSGKWICTVYCPAGGIGEPAYIKQKGEQLEFTNEGKIKSKGRFIDSSTIIAYEWEGGLRATIEKDAKEIHWKNTTIWVR